MAENQRVEVGKMCVLSGKNPTGTIDDKYPSCPSLSVNSSVAVFRLAWVFETLGKLLPSPVKHRPNWIDTSPKHICHLANL